MKMNRRPKSLAAWFHPPSQSTMKTRIYFWKSYLWKGNPAEVEVNAKKRWSIGVQGGPNQHLRTTNLKWTRKIGDGYFLMILTCCSSDRRSSFCSSWSKLLQAPRESQTRMLPTWGQKILFWVKRIPGTDLSKKGVVLCKEKRILLFGIWSPCQLIKFSPQQFWDVALEPEQKWAKCLV